MSLAELSRVLYSPTTLVLYLGAAFVYLYALTTTVGRQEERDRGRRAQTLGGVLAVLGITSHIAHEVIRGLAQDRLPLGNMFEVSSLMALVGVVVGLVYLRFVRRRAELSGFVLLGGALVLAMAMLMYADPGPLMPILDTWWRPFHVSLLVAAMGIFAAASVFNGLYLLKDTAERRTDARSGATLAEVGSGAATARTATASIEVGEGFGPPAVSDHDPGQPSHDRPPGEASLDEQERARLLAQHQAMRAAISPVRLSAGVFLGASLVSWVWLVTADTLEAGLGRFLTVNLTLVAVALLARWLVPFLPAKETLDGIAYRTIAFAFVLWTVGVIAGAMWAEVSWGRFWGWDPKETGSFLTWVVYAAYLHARATRGVRGRGAAWIGMGAFIVLMGTYLVANYVIVGLHSYADL